MRGLVDYRIEPLLVSIRDGNTMMGSPVLATSETEGVVIARLARGQSKDLLKHRKKPAGFYASGFNARKIRVSVV